MLMEEPGTELVQWGFAMSAPGGGVIAAFFAQAVRSVVMRPFLAMICLAAFQAVVACEFCGAGEHRSVCGPVVSEFVRVGNLKNERG